MIEKYLFCIQIHSSKFGILLDALLPKNHSHDIFLVRKFQFTDNEFSMIKLCHLQLFNCILNKKQEEWNESRPNSGIICPLTDYLAVDWKFISKIVDMLYKRLELKEYDSGTLLIDTRSGNLYQFQYIQDNKIYVKRARQEAKSIDNLDTTNTCKIIELQRLDTVAVYHFDIRYLEALKLIPLKLYQLEHYIADYEFVTSITDHEDRVELNIFILALTLGHNEHLRWLGATLYKLYISEFLYTSMPNANEQSMSEKRREFDKHEPLNKNKWIPNIYHIKFNAKKYCPAGFPQNQVFDPNEAPYAIDGMFHALLAAFYLFGGRSAAYKFLIFSGYNITMECFISCGNDKIKHPHPQSDNIEKLIGYKFIIPQLLTEAFTHRSFRPRSYNSYERVEFLGDAVLCTIVSFHLYNIMDRECNAGDLNLMRSRVTCNEFLIEATMANELYKFIQIKHTLYDKKIAPYLKTKENPPKILADIFESLIGAVYIDSGKLSTTLEMLFQLINIEVDSDRKKIKIKPFRLSLMNLFSDINY